MDDRRPAGGHLDGDALCDFAEGLLAADARRAAEAHLAACPDCRRELAAMQGYFREVAGLKAEVHKAPDRFLTKVHARLERASPWRRLLRALSSPRLLPVPLTALTLALLAGLTFHLSRDLQVAESAPMSGAAPEERIARIPSQEDARPRARSGEAPRSEPSASGKQAPNPAEDRSAGRSEAPPAPERFATRTPEPAKPAPAVPAAKPAEPAPPGADRLAAAEAESRGPAAAAADAQPSSVAPERLASRPVPAAAPQAAKAAEESDEASAQARVEEPALARADRAESKAKKSEAAKGESANLKEAPASAPASEPLAAAPPAPAGSSPLSGRRGRVEANAPGYAGGEGAGAGQAAPPQPQVTPAWAPEVYLLTAGDLPPLDMLRRELASLEVRILRAEGGPRGRYELSVPATRLPQLEARLRAYGTLDPTGVRPARPSGAPWRLTVRLRSPADPR